jgi:hypothetical protein
VLPEINSVWKDKTTEQLVKVTRIFKLYDSVNYINFKYVIDFYGSADFIIEDPYYPLRYEDFIERFIKR